MTKNAAAKRPARPLRYQTLALGQQKIRVATCRLEDNSGRTPLLIFNGIGASAELLEPLLLELKRPALTFDMPGIGGSSLAILPRRMSHFAKLTADILDALNIPSAHVLGVSWGGGLAQQFAYQYEDRCVGLILASTSTGHLMVPPSPSVLFRMATPLRYYSSSYFKRVAGDIYGGDFRNNEKLAVKHAKVMAPPTISGYLFQLFAAMGWTSLFWLHRLKQATLVMAGNDDPIVRLVNARILANRIPNATLKVFDCGHLFILTRLEEAVKSINEFLSVVDQNSAPINRYKASDRGTDIAPNTGRNTTVLASRTDRA